MTLRELAVRDEARFLAEWDALVTLEHYLERLVCLETGQRPKTWLQLHPLRRTLPGSRDLPAVSGFDALLELARL